MSERETHDVATFTDAERPGSAPAKRRAHPRHAVELDVSLGSEHNFYAGFVENLSAGGVFIATHLVKPVGERMEFSIHLPNRKHPVRGIGEVRWLRDYSESNEVPPGIGVRFVQLEGDAQEAIEQFIACREPMFWDD